MHLELCGVERIMATSLPLSLLVTPPSNQASHGSAGYFCKYVYHVFRGGELERRTNGVWQRRKIGGKGRQMAIRAVVISGIFAVDPWAPNVDSQSIASLLFAASLFPYLGFLYHITKSQSAPKLTLFGFYFLLAFVGATIPAGIYAKIHYGTSLSNVDWLHGSAESLLTLTNLFIVLGLRQSLRKEESRQRSLDINNKKGTTAMEKERTSV